MNQPPVSRHADYCEDNVPAMPQNRVHPYMREWARTNTAPAPEPTEGGTYPWSAIDALNNKTAMINIAAEMTHVDEGIGTVLPTLLEYLGLGHLEIADSPGESFAPMLRGRDLAWEDEVFFEYISTRVIQTRQWKYTKRFLASPNELYDMTDDIRARPGISSTIRRLRTLPRTWTHALRRSLPSMPIPLSTCGTAAPARRWFAMANATGNSATPSPTGANPSGKRLSAANYYQLPLYKRSKFLNSPALA